jgi:glutamate-1-semialdehyde aminotransferase
MIEHAVHINNQELAMPNGIDLNNDYPSIAHSDELYARALGLIPCVTQTLAKGPGQNIRGVAPKYLQRGNGSHVWDVDGNEFIDFNMGIGPISLGYCHPPVDDAIRAQLADGNTFSLMHPLEVEVAELIRDLVPNAEAVRYSKTGCDVTTAAVRLARAYTGRSKVLCCGYHGWHDWYIAVTDRNRGIPAEVQDLTYTFSYNDIQSVIDAIDDDTACVILEPFVFEEPRDNFLHRLKDICEANGTLLIFDEMWTGFRVALGGAQEYFGIRADLACFSKAVANGMPISILTGRRDVMDLLERDVFFFTTFGGEALSLAAAKATINELREHNVPEHLARQGRKLKDGYNAIAAKLGIDYTRCSGFDCRTIVTFDAKAGNPLEMKSLVQQEMIKRGILWGGFHNICFSHSDEDVAYTLSAYREVLPILKRAVDEKNVAGHLRGEPVEPVFRKTSNFNTKPKRASGVAEKI